MSREPDIDMASVQDIAQLDRYMADRGLGGSWRRDGPPRSVPRPFLWKWTDLHEALLRVGQTVARDETGAVAGRLAGRKLLDLRNPSAGPGGLKTISAGVQVLMPGEIAEAHRHSQTGLRFVIKGGPGAYMVVEGERFPMGDGDLIAMPAWSWQDCRNEGSDPVWWLDGLDLPLARLAQAVLPLAPPGGEAGPRSGLGEGADIPGTSARRLREPRQNVVRPNGYSAAILGGARPIGPASSLPGRPFRYAWSETFAALVALEEAGVAPHPCGGFHITYTHPATGGPTATTMAAELQLLPPGQPLRAHRHNCATFYHVVRGAGATTVEEEELAWSQGDVFFVPPWTWRHHENPGTEDAILYSFTDRPTLQALGFYREEEASA